MLTEFIHTADWHLGNSFSNFSSKMRKDLNNAIFLTVESIFIYAKSKRIPLILCAGDAIDNGQLTDPSHLDRLIRIVSKYPEVKLILIAGNHDPLMSNSVYFRMDKSLYPANFTLVMDDDIISMPELNLNIFASSIREKNGNYNTLNWINDADIDSHKINVGLAHGSIQNQRFSNNSFPIEPDFAKQKKLDYLALGDWHSYQKINGRTYYPGTPEPLQFGDQGFPLKVTIKEPGAVPKVEPITGIKQYTWIDLEKTISDDALSEFKTEFSSIGLREIKRIKISGFLSPQNFKIYKDLLRLYQPQYFYISDYVSLHPDDNKLKEISDSNIGEIVNKLLELKKSKDKLPENIFNRIVPVDREEVEKKAESIKADEVFDRALLKIYQLVSE